MTVTAAHTNLAPRHDEEEILPKRYKLGPISQVAKLVWGAIFTHIGLLIVAALYFIFLEVHYDFFGLHFTLKNVWDHNVQPASLRHTIRDVGEGVLGGFLAKGIMWNHFTKSHQKAGRYFDLIQNRFRFLPAWLAAVITTAIVFAIVFTAGSLILHALSVHATSTATTGSWWHRTQTIWTSNHTEKILGFVCAFVASRPMHVVFDDAQGYFVSRRVCLGRKPHFFYPKSYKNRWDYLNRNQHKVRTFSHWVNILMFIAVFAGLALAGYGYYILTYVA